MFCTRCGADVGDARYCWSCGARQNPDGSEQELTQVGGAQAREAEADGPPTPAAPAIGDGDPDRALRSGSHKRPGRILLVLTVVALVGGGAMAVALIRDSGQDGPGGPQRDPTKSLAVGGASACVLDGGQVKCWGDDSYGGLGNGPTSGEDTCRDPFLEQRIPCSTTPVRVRGLKNATAISHGGWVTCALLVDHTISCWGDNRSGSLGAGTSAGPETCRPPDGDSYPCSTTPVRVKGITNATAVSSHSSTTCALLADGTVECWGDNRDGELGIGTFTGPETCSLGPCSTKPVKVPGIDHATAITAGCAVLSTGEVKCWGDNSAGGLGNGALSGPETCSQPGVPGTPCSTRPVRVRGISEATALATGGGQTCALLRSGGINCWGYNGGGQLGNGTDTGPQTCSSDQECSTVPVPVIGIEDATAITAGGGFTCALRAGGRVACWGNNVDGKLGDGGEGIDANRATPRDVPGISRAIAISAGDSSACARFSTDIRCWGVNTAGQLGIGTFAGPESCSFGACSTRPVKVLGIDRATAITAD
jgi:alpha-tubulin suppressor-like RCC1 family protein